VIGTYCTVPEASVTNSVPVITSAEHHVTLIVQFAPAASVPQLFVCLNWPVMRTDLIDVLVLRGLVTVTVPPAQLNRIKSGGESVTRAPLPLTGADFEGVPASENVTAPFRSPPFVGWNVTEAEQFCPPASDTGQVFVAGKSGNDDATELTVKGAVLIFVSTVSLGRTRCAHQLRGAADVYKSFAPLSADLNRALAGVRFGTGAPARDATNIKLDVSECPITRSAATAAST